VKDHLLFLLFTKSTTSPKTPKSAAPGHCPLPPLSGSWYKHSIVSFHHNRRFSIPCLLHASVHCMLAICGANIHRLVCNPYELSITGIGNLFRTADWLVPSRAAFKNNECLVRTQIYYNSLRHHGTDSVRDLGLLCCSNMLRPVGIMVVNGTRSVFLMSVVPVTLEQLGFCAARPGNNFSTDRHRAAARCLPTPGV